MGEIKKQQEINNINYAKKAIPILIIRIAFTYIN